MSFESFAAALREIARAAEAGTTSNLLIARLARALEREFAYPTGPSAGPVLVAVLERAATLVGAQGAGADRVPAARQGRGLDGDLMNDAVEGHVCPRCGTGDAPSASGRVRAWTYTELPKTWKVTLMVEDTGYFTREGRHEVGEAARILEEFEGDGIASELNTGLSITSVSVEPFDGVPV